MFGPIPMIHLGTVDRPPGKREAITPQAIAAGRGDAYIFALNAAIAGFGKLVYVRPMAEMNNKINLYSYDRKHDAAHSPPAYQSAFCRIHSSGTAGRRTRSTPGSVRGPAADRPGSRGKPVPEQAPGDLESARRDREGPEPAPRRYYPGDGCTDMIGNDMFSSSVGGGSFEENQALYDAHPRKPYSLPEWGLEGWMTRPSSRNLPFIKTTAARRWPPTTRAVRLNRDLATSRRARRSTALHRPLGLQRASPYPPAIAACTPRLSEHGLGRREPRERDAIGRAGDVVEPDAVAERHRPRLSPVLAADSHLQVVLHAAAALDRDSHQLADALLVDHLERVALEHAVLEVARQELALGVVAREAERRLSQIVRPEGEEVGLAGDLVGADARSRQLDHRPDLVVEVTLLSSRP